MQRGAERLLTRTLDGEAVDEAALYELCSLTGGAPLTRLLDAASALRDRRWGRTVTYSRKVFLPLTNLCRDRCGYCTFRKDPDDPEAWTMSPDEVAGELDRAAAQGCKEALVCLGDWPETAYREYRSLLGTLGHSSTVDYIARACAMALERGLLPHTNAGVLRRDEMARLKEVNVSLGLMLETTSERLRKPGMPHHRAPDKAPAVRLRMLREAGELQIPFTTGILIGIGETRQERIDSLMAIRELDARYGHIQEVIIQNFRAKESTPMRAAPEPDDGEVVWTVAVARLILGEAMSIQAPPNLNPGLDAALLAAGINDFGGISPVTRDYVNPEAPWPHTERLGESCASVGFTLRERLAIYSAYVDRPGFLAERCRPQVAALQARIA